MSDSIGAAVAESIRTKPDEWHNDYGILRHEKTDVRVEIRHSRTILGPAVIVSLESPERLERTVAPLSRRERSQVIRAVDAWKRLQDQRARAKVLAALTGTDNDCNIWPPHMPIPTEEQRQAVRDYGPLSNG